MIINLEKKMKYSLLALLVAAQSWAGDVHQCSVKKDSATKPEISVFYIDRGAKFIIQMPVIPKADEPVGSGDVDWDVVHLQRDHSQPYKLYYKGSDKERQFTALVTNASENPIARGTYDVSIQAFKSGDSRRDGVVTHHLNASCSYFKQTTDN